MGNNFLHLGKNLTWWVKNYNIFQKSNFSPMLPCLDQNLPQIFQIHFLCTHNRPLALTFWCCYRDTPVNGERTLMYYFLPSFRFQLLCNLCQFMWQFLILGEILFKNDLLYPTCEMSIKMIILYTVSVIERVEK